MIYFIFFDVFSLYDDTSEFGDHACSVVVFMSSCHHINVMKMMTQARMSTVLSFSRRSRDSDKNERNPLLTVITIHV